MMKEAIFMLVIIGTFGYVFFLVRQLDRFLEKNRRLQMDAAKKKEPSCVILEGDLSEKEIINAVHRFQKKHQDMRIILYDYTQIDLSKYTSSDMN